MAYITKEEFLSAMCQMDVAKLEELLGDFNIYMGVRLPLLMEKFNDVFDEMQSRGDDYLIAHEGECNGGISNCPSSGMRGFQFVGDHTGDYINLIIKVQNHGKLDFCDCASFQAKQAETNGKGERIRIEIGQDELAGFHDPAYDCLVELGDQALAELSDREDHFVDLPMLKNWVQKYEAIYKALPALMIFHVRGKAFHSTYKKMRDIVNEISASKEVNEAMNAHPGPDADKGLKVNWFDSYKKLQPLSSQTNRIIASEGFPERILKIHEEPLILLDCKSILDQLKFPIYMDEASDLKFVEGVKPKKK